MLREWMRRNAHHSLSYHRPKHDRSEIQFNLRRIRASSAVCRHLFRNALASSRSLSRISSFFIAQRLAWLSHIKTDVNELICSFFYDQSMHSVQSNGLASCGSSLRPTMSSSIHFHML